MFSLNKVKGSLIFLVIHVQYKFFLHFYQCSQSVYHSRFTLYETYQLTDCTNYRLQQGKGTI